jgi:hypothetical protein
MITRDLTEKEQQDFTRGSWVCLSSHDGISNRLAISLSLNFSDNNRFDAGVASGLVLEITGLRPDGKQARISVHLEGRHLNDRCSEHELAEKLQGFVKEFKRLHEFVYNTEPGKMQP